MGAPATSNKSGKFGGRIFKFFREVRKELTKVQWPSRSEVMTYTAVVIVTVILVASLIWLVDTAITAILKLILLR